MTPKRAKRRSEADFWAQISITFPREFRRPIKFALLRPAPFFEAENRRPREGDSFDRSSLASDPDFGGTQNDQAVPYPPPGWSTVLGYSLGDSRGNSTGRTPRERGRELGISSGTLIYKLGLGHSLSYTCKNVETRRDSEFARVPPSSPEFAREYPRLYPRTVDHPGGG